MTVDRFVEDLRMSHVELYIADGQLRYRAPEGTLTTDMREYIHEHRDAIWQYLCPAPRELTTEGCRCFRSDWVDQPPENGSIRTICSVCGKFIGFRPSIKSRN